MTAAASNATTVGRIAFGHLVQRLAVAGGSIVAGICSRWAAIVDAGQLGPGREASVSRHTGARI